MTLGARRMIEILKVATAITFLVVVVRTIINLFDEINKLEK